MGRGIVMAAANADFEVVLVSRSLVSATRAVNGLGHDLGREVKRGRITHVQRSATLDRVHPTADLHDTSDCQLVIESIIEELPAKIALFALLDDACGENTVLASNTSTLPLSQIACATNRVDRVCGLHFFNPVQVTKVVEVIRTNATSAATIDRARSFSRRCQKQPVVVGDGSGFVVNALLMPMLNRAVKMLQRGVASIEDIDAAMRGACGLQSGPFQLLDLIGVDTAVQALDAIYLATDDDAYRPAPQLREMLASGRLGRKSARGFYRYA